jgi:hypothetical protein
MHGLAADLPPVGRSYRSRRPESAKQAEPGVQLVADSARRGRMGAAGRALAASNLNFDRLGQTFGEPPV